MIFICMITEICTYGCDRKAKFVFKNGNYCCESSPNKCPHKRFLDSQKKKGRFKGTPAWQIDGFEYKPWNKGKKGIYTEEHKSKISNSLKGKSKGIGATPEKELERKKKISETMKKNPSSGGLRKGSGRGKKGWYKGFWCDSSWELSWVIYNLDHNIPFIRNTQYFTYQMNGKIKKYYPDFIIEDVFYEIKGRRNFEQIDEENKQKIMQFEKKLVVLYEEEMKPYLNYVIDKYGKNFYNLYDKMEE